MAYAKQAARLFEFPGENVQRPLRMRRGASSLQLCGSAFLRRDLLAAGVVGLFQFVLHGMKHGVQPRG
jgi:hypothetical protein